MACNNPTSPIPTPRDILNKAYIASTSENGLLRNYENYRDALIEAATAGSDPYPFQDPIRLIKNFADGEAEKLALLGGDESKLRALIKLSYEMLPPEHINE